MRVGLVCPYSVDVHGGVQSHVLELAEALRDGGHAVSVLAPGERAGRLPAYVTTTGRSLAMPYNGSVARVAFGPWVAGRVRRWVEGGRFDVLHIHEPATPSVSVLALWAARGPVVATFHTAQERSWALETSAATFLRPGLGKIDAHLAVSAQAGETMARYLDVEPLLIPNGVRTRAFARPVAEARPGVGGGPTIAFVGRLDEPRKGLAVLLAALPALLSRHPGTRLVLVGAGASRGLLRGLDPAVSARVDLRGAVDDDEKADVLAGADLVVAPNLHGESFGIVLVEAMAAGTAVLASDLPAFRAVLGEGRHGALFRAGDAGDLALRAGDLLADGRRRRALALRGRGEARRYDWDVVAPRVAEVYAAVTSEDWAAQAG